MKPALPAALGGCGCGLITTLTSFVLCGGSSVFGAWGAYEADLTEMTAETAVPLGVGLSTLAAPAMGLVATIVVGAAIYVLFARRAPKAA